VAAARRDIRHFGKCHSNGHRKKKEPDFHFRVAIYPPRRAPERSTADLSRPCEFDTGFRGGRPRPCLLCAHRLSADSVRVDAGRLARPRPYARARCVRKKGKIGI
jgi:hypothetical protein